MDTLFIDYENSLIGRHKAIGTYDFFGLDNTGANEKKALILIRYVLEEVLEWSCLDSVQGFDAYIIHLMQLDRVVEFIHYPDDVRYCDPRYILSLLYPGEVRINRIDMIINIYKDVLRTNHQFPRGYFIGTHGLYRYCTCLAYLTHDIRPMNSVEGMYQFLSSAVGRRFLSRYRLKVPLQQLSLDLYDCIRRVTYEAPGSELYYHFYKFLRDQMGEFAEEAVDEDGGDDEDEEEELFLEEEEDLI